MKSELWEVAAITFFLFCGGNTKQNCEIQTQSLEKNIRITRKKNLNCEIKFHYYL